MVQRDTPTAYPVEPLPLNYALVSPLLAPFPCLVLWATCLSRLSTSTPP